MLFLKPKHESHESRILKHLKKAGHHGEFNYNLSKQSVGSWDWRKYISNLRHDGYNIQRVQVSRAVHKYYLVSEPEE